MFRTGRKGECVCVSVACVCICISIQTVYMDVRLCIHICVYVSHEACFCQLLELQAEYHERSLDFLKNKITAVKENPSEPGRFFLSL